MNSVNKTLYIPLYGKAMVSKQGILLHDAKAEEIWQAEGFPLKGKSKSKWLAYNMSMRSAVFDRWLEQKLQQHPESIVLHLGCGMDSRVLRVKHPENPWLDVDFPEVISQRKQYFSETCQYRMIGSDIRQKSWLDTVPQGGHALLVMEGVSMYLPPEELRSVLAAVSGHFDSLDILMDTYTVFAAKVSKYKNPINDVGVTQVYGFDDPIILETSGIRYVCNHSLTPEDMIGQLPGFEKIFFKKMFAGKTAQKIYRLYEYSKP